MVLEIRTWGRAFRGAVLLLGTLSGVASGQVDTMSLAADGSPATASSAAVSADGRYVVFTSMATDLTAEQRAGTFVRDRLLLQTLWIGPGLSAAGISSNGRYVLHRPGAEWAVLDRQTGRVDEVPPVGGVPGFPAQVLQPVLSAEGRHVAFYSDVRPPDPGYALGAFVRNLDTREVCVAHVGPGSVVGDTPFGPVDRLPSLALSGNGRLVAYASRATNLVSGPSEANTTYGFVHDCASRSTERIQDRRTTYAPRGVVGVSMSADGETIAIRQTEASGGRYFFITTSISVFERISGHITSVASEFELYPAPFSVLSDAAVSSDGRFVSYVLRGGSVVRLDRSLRRTIAPVSSEGFFFGSPPTISGDGRVISFVTNAPELVGPTFVPPRAFVYDDDLDGDGMPEPWETFFGFDPRQSSDGGTDSDGDGKTNLQEFRDSTHPRGLASASRFFAEGVSRSQPNAGGGLRFGTEIHVANPNTTEARVQLRYVTGDGRVLSERLLVPPLRMRRTFEMPAESEFAAIVESDVPIAADRDVGWGAPLDPNDGSASETAVAAPSTTWYFAEGSTASGFDVFYLLVNPGANAVQISGQFLLPTGVVVTRSYEVPAGRRLTVWANADPALASTDLSAVFTVTAGGPIVAERAMYLSRGNRRFLAGHTAAGARAPALEWTLAEGATGDFFDLFVLLANPTSTSALVEVTYLLPDGSTHLKQYSVPPTSRLNIWVDHERFSGVAALADTAVSTTVRSANGVPVVVERAMWWPGPFASWEESHASAGATAAGTRWVVPYVGPSYNPDNYVLIANRSSVGGRVRVTPLSGNQDTPPSPPPSPREYVLPATSRLTLLFNEEFRASGPFGALVEALDPLQLVVERSTYEDVGFGPSAVRWGRGSNSLGERLP